MCWLISHRENINHLLNSTVLVECKGSHQVTLNIIYFTSSTQKTHGTYLRVLEDADVDVCGHTSPWKTSDGRTNTMAHTLTQI